MILEPLLNNSEEEGIGNGFQAGASTAQAAVEPRSGMRSPCAVIPEPGRSETGALGSHGYMWHPENSEPPAGFNREGPDPMEERILHFAEKIAINSQGC